MMPVAEERVTAQDYRALPQNGQRYQLVEGDLYMAPAPNRFHQEIALNIVLNIANYLKSRPVGKIFIAPFDVYLNDANVFQPDLVFIASGNYGVLTDTGVEGAPDLIIEILSTGTAKLDRNPKRRVYAESGVKELWLVDPQVENVAVYYLQLNPNQPVSVYSTTDRFKSPFFPDLELAVSDFFRR